MKKLETIIEEQKLLIRKEMATPAQGVPNPQHIWNMAFVRAVEIYFNERIKDVKEQKRNTNSGK